MGFCCWGTEDAKERRSISADPSEHHRLPAGCPQTGFSLGSSHVLQGRGNDGETAFRGEAIGPATNADTEEQVYIADFSALKISGEYRLEVGALVPRRPSGLRRCLQLPVLHGDVGLPSLASIRAIPSRTKPATPRMPISISLAVDMCAAMQ